MSNPTLFLIVYEVLDGEPDWFFTVQEGTYLSTDQEEKLALNNYLSFHDYTDEDKAEAVIDDHLGSVWSEKVYTPEGYTIKLEKVEANAKA